MYVAVWQFRIVPASREAFLAAYGPQGEWAQLFRRVEGYIGTELLASIDESDSYVTIDRWRSREDFTRFQQRFADEYHALDERCASLTVSEIKLGIYEPVEG